MNEYESTMCKWDKYDNYFKNNFNEIMDKTKFIHYDSNFGVYKQFWWMWDSNSGFRWNCSKVATMKLISCVIGNGTEEVREDSFSWVIFLSMLLILSVRFVFNKLQSVQWQRCLKYNKSFK